MKEYFNKKTTPRQIIIMESKESTTRKQEIFTKVRPAPIHTVDGDGKPIRLNMYDRHIVQEPYIKKIKKTIWHPKRMSGREVVKDIYESMAMGRQANDSSIIDKAKKQLEAIEKSKQRRSELDKAAYMTKLSVNHGTNRQRKRNLRESYETIHS